MQEEVRDIIQRVETLATPIVAEEGIELWGVDFRPEGGRWILRLALDREGGVTLDDLTQVHRQLGDVLDAHDLVPWRYTLEVSSPGIRRTLVRPSHYQRYCGKRIRVQIQQEQQGKRTFIGILQAVEPNHIVLIDELVGEVRLAWGDIRKATTEYQFPPPATGKRKGRQR